MKKFFTTEDTEKTFIIVSRTSGAVNMKNLCASTTAPALSAYGRPALICGE
ncbi:MAG: hypothetical protein BMS9Abin19_0013 [Gammaproteobacteria bacterium]|nr:MAG: hypothetical protein BMS9Abin19_0013 [Gammaproteobacteria bacterium]